MRQERIEIAHSLQILYGVAAVDDVVVERLRVGGGGRDHVERVESGVERSEESEGGVGGGGGGEETVAEIGGGDGVPEEIVVGDAERGLGCGELLFEGERDCGRDEERDEGENEEERER